MSETVEQFNARMKRERGKGLLEMSMEELFDQLGKEMVKVEAERQA